MPEALDANAVLTMAEQKKLEKLTSAACRQKVIDLLAEANAAGAGYARACNVTCICLRTLKRWRREFKAAGNGVDRRKGSTRKVAHRLSLEEGQRILLTCN